MHNATLSGGIPDHAPKVRRRFGEVMYVRMVCDKCGLVAWDGGQALECPECVRLTAEYKRLHGVYAELVDELQIRIGSLPASEYARLKATREKARTIFKTARLEFDQHLRSHGDMV